MPNMDALARAVDRHKRLRAAVVDAVTVTTDQYVTAEAERPAMIPGANVPEATTQEGTDDERTDTDATGRAE